MQIGTLYKHSYAPGSIFKLVEIVSSDADIELNAVTQGSGYGADISTGRVLYHSFRYVTPLPTSSLLKALLGASCK